MNFDFSDEQHMLRDEVRKFLVKESPLKVARDVLEQGLTHSRPVWRGLAGLGATALMLPDDCGGAGLGAMELCVVAEELGRQLSPVPLASTLYLAAQAVLLGGTAAQQQRWLSPVAEGAIGAFAAPLDGGSTQPRCRVSMASASPASSLWWLTAAARPGRWCWPPMGRSGRCGW